MDIDSLEFLAQFKEGFARPNRFAVSFPPPKGIPSGTNGGSLPSMSAGRMSIFSQTFGGNSARINLKCHAAMLPQRSFMTHEQSQNSAPFRIPHSAQYDPVTFSFYADSTMDSRRYFDAWQGAVCNFANNTMNFFDEYTSDVEIATLDGYGEARYGVILYEAWPINVSIVDLSYANINNVQIINITMNYKAWASYNEAGINRTVAQNNES